MVEAINDVFWFHSPYAENEVVKGSSLKSLRRHSAFECGLACMDESSCESFNFGEKDQACELHTKIISDVGKALRDGYQYFELPRDGELMYIHYFN